MVSRRLAADKAPELAGLDFQHAAVGHFILELRWVTSVSRRRNQASQKALRPRSFEEGAGGAPEEILGGDFGAIEEANGDAVGGDGPELLHEVQGESGASVSRLVHECQERGPGPRRGRRR